MIYKIYSSWITALNITAKTIKFLGENKRLYPRSSGRQRFFIQDSKEKIYKLYFINLKFLVIKTLLRKLKDKPQPGRKYL